MRESPVAHWLVTGLVWVVVATGVWWTTSREAMMRTKALSARVHTVRTAYDTARITAIQAQFATKEAARREQRLGQALTERLRSVQDSLASARAVAEDSTATADSLRVALRETVRQADSLLFQVSAYMGAVDSLKQAHARERLAMAAALERADTVIATQDTLIRTLRAKECHILGSPCPTRTQVFIAGTVIGIVLGLAR